MTQILPERRPLPGSRPLPEVVTEIRVFPVTHPERFVWAIEVSSNTKQDSALCMAGTAPSALQARFAAGEMCQRIALACLKPWVDGIQLELKALQENPSGADLSREHTA